MSVAVSVFGVPDFRAFGGFVTGPTLGHRRVIGDTLGGEIDPLKVSLRVSWFIPFRPSQRLLRDG